VLAGTVGFVDGVLPRAAELQHFGTANEALTAIRDEIGLRPAPLAQRRRPLLRPGPIEDFVAGLEHAAVDVACENGGDFAGDDRDHRLIEQTDTLCDLSQPNQRATAPMPRERHEIAVSEPFADLDRLPKQVECGAGVAVDDASNGARDEKKPADDGIGAVFIEGAFGADNPTVSEGRLASIEQLER